MLFKKMFAFIKPSRFVLLYNCLPSSRQNFLIMARPFTCCRCELNATLPKLNITNCDPYKMIIIRQKSSKKKGTFKKAVEEEDESDDDDDDIEEEDSDLNFKGDEVKTFEIQAPRVDKIIKVCFKISRKKIEDMFYEAKVRVNGKILKKKSANTSVGDEIDLINGFVSENSRLLNVNRIKILHIKEDLDNLRYSIKVKKSNSLVVENYTGSDVWRG